jgi:hypothetical protein
LENNKEEEKTERERERGGGGREGGRGEREESHTHTQQNPYLQLVWGTRILDLRSRKILNWGCYKIKHKNVL